MRKKWTLTPLELKFTHIQNYPSNAELTPMWVSVLCGGEDTYRNSEIQLQKISVTCEFQLDTCGGGGDLLTYRNIPHMQSSLTCRSQLHVKLRMLSHAEIPLMYRFHLRVGLSYAWISVMWGDGVPSHIALNMTKRATKVKFLTPWYFLNLGWWKSTE